MLTEDVRRPELIIFNSGHNIAWISGLIHKICVRCARDGVQPCEA